MPNTMILPHLNHRSQFNLIENVLQIENALNVKKQPFF